MSTAMAPTKMHLFFIVDRVLGLGASSGVVESHLQGMVADLERDAATRARCRYYLVPIGMQAHTCVQSLAPHTQLRIPPIQCDFVQAVREVEKTLNPREADTAVELLIFLGSQPADGWQEPLQRLKTVQRAKVTVCDVSEGSIVATEDLKAIRTSDGTALKFAIRELGKAVSDTILPGIRQALLDKGTLAERRPDEVQQAKPPSPPHAQQGPMAPTTIVAVQPRLGEGPPPSVIDPARAYVPPTVPSPPVPEIDLNWNRPAIQAGGSAAPPAVDKDGVATLWKEIEPPSNLEDRVPHNLAKVRPGSPGWDMIAASRRGKMHAHKGIFREDSFALDEVDGWHVLVVADGGGSCPLSRVGSLLAAQEGVAAMRRWVEQTAGASLPAEAICEQALREGIDAAWDRLDEEAKRRGRDLRDFGTTYLALMHREAADGHVVGVLQVGDGLIAAEMADGALLPLATGDVGEVAGVTLFVTSKPKSEWIDRAAVTTLASPPRLIAAMCDGVADDFIPYDQYLGRLFGLLHDVAGQANPHQKLLDMLGYDKRGSFDDRTLAMIVRRDSSSGGDTAAPSGVDAIGLEQGPVMDAGAPQAIVAAPEPHAPLAEEPAASGSSAAVDDTRLPVVVETVAGEADASLPPPGRDAGEEARMTPPRIEDAAHNSAS